MNIRDVEDALGADAGQMDARVSNFKPVWLYESEPGGGRENYGGEGCEQGSSGHLLQYSTLLIKVIYHSNSGAPERIVQGDIHSFGRRGIRSESPLLGCGYCRIFEERMPGDGGDSVDVARCVVDCKTQFHLPLDARLLRQWRIDGSDESSELVVLGRGTSFALEILIGPR